MYSSPGLPRWRGDVLCSSYAMPFYRPSALTAISGHALLTIAGILRPPLIGIGSYHMASAS